MNRLRQAFPILCPVIQCRQYIDTAGQTNEESGKHGDQCGCGPYRSQRQGTGELTDHRNIRHVEKHL